MPTVCLTFDVDAEAGLGAALAPHRLKRSPSALFGIAHGLPRIVEVLGAHAMRVLTRGEPAKRAVS